MLAASPTLRRSLGGSIIADDNKENCEDESSPLTKTLTDSSHQQTTPVKTTPVTDHHSGKPKVLHMILLYLG